MKLLCIDYGKKRVGLAISFASLAQPLSTIANDPKLIKSLIKVCNQHQVDKIIIGISEGKMASETKQFASKLKESLTVPLIFQDETLSSQLAAQKLLLAKKSKRIQPQDKYQAAVILQYYLNGL